MPDMKGITVRIDAALHAEIKAYLEQHEMTMGEFIALAAQDELHPKIPEVEVREVGNTRTLAFQVPEELFQRIKDYLKRNNMTQRAFVIGLIEDELDRDEELLRKQQEGLSGVGDAPVSEDAPDVEQVDEPEGTAAVGDSEGSSDEPDEDASEQDFIESEPEYSESPDEISAEPNDGEFPEEEQDEGISGDSEAPVSEDAPDIEQVDEPEGTADVGDFEGGSDEPDEEEFEQDFTDDESNHSDPEDAEGPVEDGKDESPELDDEDSVISEPAREFVEGELGAAVEVVSMPVFGEDAPADFPEPDDEEDQDYGMNMGM